MFKNAKRIIAVLLAVTLVLSLAGCSEPEGDGSSVEVEHVIKEVHVSGESTTSEENTQSNNSSGNESVTSKPTTSNNDSSGGNPSTDYSKSPILANPKDYEGSKIILALTIDPKDDGSDYVVSRFEQEYGIDVDVIVLTHGNYNSEMSNLIAANKAPTVGISNGDAPLFVGYFQSLDAAKLNYKHPLWNQNTFKLSDFGNGPVLCDTVGNFWTELDITVYSKSLLRRAQCPTPQELDKQGKWTFDSYLSICKKTAELDGCYGGSVGYYDTVLHAAGGALYRRDKNNRLVSGIDTKTSQAFRKISEAFEGGYLSVRQSQDFINGTIAIKFSHAWDLRVDGSLATHANWNDIGFYYLPSFDDSGKYAQTGMFRGYGIIKECNSNPKTGPKSAVAGGFFLSEYLDVNNYDLDRSFISEEAKTFFFKVCDAYANADNYDPYYTAYALNSGISGFDHSSLFYPHLKDDPTQIGTFLASIKSSVDGAVNKLNGYIDQNA